MTPEGKAELDRIRKVRGYTLPFHEVLAETNPEFLKRYGHLASHVLFGDEEGRSLDLKTRYLVLVGITTAVKGDREGIEFAAARALRNGATWTQVYEAAFLAAGVPAFEGACGTFKGMQEGTPLVEQQRPDRQRPDQQRPDQQRPDQQRPE